MTDTTLMPDAVRVHDQEFIERLVLEVAMEDDGATQDWALSNGWKIVDVGPHTQDDGTHDTSALRWIVERVSEKVF